MRGHLERVGRDLPAVDRVAGRVDVEPHRVGEEAAEGLEDPAPQIPIVRFVEQLAEQGHAKHDPGALNIPLGEVVGEPVERPEVADKDELADRREEIDPGEEVGIVNLAGVAEVVHGNLHDLHDRLIALARLPLGVGGEEHRGRRDHLEIEPRHRTEPASLEEHTAPADRLGGEQGLAVGAEEHRMREADPHEMEGEEPVVDAGEDGPPHHHPIDLEALPPHVVEERLEQLVGIAPVMDTGMDEVHAKTTEGILLAGIARVEHPNVDDDVIGGAAGLLLEANPHPGVPVIPTGVGLRGRGVGKGKEPRARSTRLLEPFPKE